LSRADDNPALAGIEAVADPERIRQLDLAVLDT
jgi:hypothetical protein